MDKSTQIRFKSYLLPNLGKLIPGSKNVLSPMGLQFNQQPTPDEIIATGLLDSQGRLLAQYQPLLAVLANPTSLVDLRFDSGGYLQQFSLYYGQPDTLPILLMNTREGLLLEYPANTKAIVDGLTQFSSDSLVVSFDFEATLPTGPALALAALIDFHRRGLARAFADLSPAETITASLPEIHHWITDCPADPQWISALMPQPGPESLSPAQLESDLNALTAQGLCQAAGKSYALAGAALALGNRMILIDNLYAVDIARVDAAGQVSFASLTTLQAGVNDLLQLNFLGDEVAFKSFSPIGFIFQIEDFLEKGGQILPDQPAPVVAAEQPPDLGSATVVWALALPGKKDLYPLADTNTIGRADTCDLTLQDGKASRQHARIERREDNFWLVDLGSSNGVFVNEQRITEAALLAPGDQIRIGDSLLTLLATTASTSTAEAATIIGLQAPIIQAADSQSQPRPIAQHAPSANTCEQCGQPLSPGAQFCATCGTPVAKKCPQCGNIISDTTRFCARCGAAVAK